VLGFCYAPSSGIWLLQSLFPHQYFAAYTDVVAIRLHRVRARLERAAHTCPSMHTCLRHGVCVLPHMTSKIDLPGWRARRTRLSYRRRQHAELRRARALRKLGVSDRDRLYVAKRPKQMQCARYERSWQAAVDALFDEDTALEHALLRHLRRRRVESRGGLSAFLEGLIDETLIPTSLSCAHNMTYSISSNA